MLYLATVLYQIHSFSSGSLGGMSHTPHSLGILKGKNLLLKDQASVEVSCCSQNEKWFAM